MIGKNDNTFISGWKLNDPQQKNGKIDDLYNELFIVGRF